MNKNTSTVLEMVEYSDFADAQQWAAEARFGFRHLQTAIEQLSSGSNILEVGCGSGILLAMLSETYAQNNFSGIEPFGDGFSSLEALNSEIGKRGVSINNTAYENYFPDKKFDLIYCVNVFEHVDNWRHFLAWVANSLTEKGRFIVLCPNYSFPYEPHFRIPIVVNKSATYSVFSKRIKDFELKQNVDGLWKSLNFVKKKQVKQFIKQNASLSLSLTDELEIMDDMFERASTDEEFRQRQAIASRIVIVLKALRIHKLIKVWPNMLPYMKLSFQKSAN